MAELGDNLRINTNTGIIFCEDGRDVAEYIKTQPINQMKDEKMPIVILSRWDFFKLCELAEVNRHLIRAA
jgi:hypothetical protein